MSEDVIMQCQRSAEAYARKARLAEEDIARLRSEVESARARVSSLRNSVFTGWKSAL